jgi:hypothetical protein
MSSVEIGLFPWRELTHLPDQPPIGEDLIGTKDTAKEYRKRSNIAWKADPESIPGHPTVEPSAAMLPIAGRGLDKWPLRVVEIGFRPAWIVAELEAHGTVDLGYRQTIAIQLEYLRLDEFCADDEQEREGKEDNRTPVPTPGKHDWDGCITVWATQWKSAAREACPHPNDA